MWPQLLGGSRVATLGNDSVGMPPPLHHGGNVADSAQLQWHRDLLREALPHMPGGMMLWSQYVTLTTQRIICESYHGSNWKATRSMDEWAPLCGWEELNERISAADQPSGSGCNCLSMVAANTRDTFAPFEGDMTALRPPGGTRGRRAWWRRRHETLGSAELASSLWRVNSGFVHDPNVHVRHLDVLRKQGANAGWLRFLVFLAQHNPEEAEVGRQEAFGRRQLSAAQSLSRQLHDPSVRPQTPEQLLVLARRLRQRSGGTGRFAEDDASQLRSQSLSFVLTPITHKYSLQWNLTLSRRLSEGREPFFEPDGPSGRSAACGATITHVWLPEAQCDPVLRQLAPGVDFWSGENWHELVGGIRRRPDGCRIVMNRAVSRPVLDGLLLGEECFSWYGSRSMSSASRLFGNMQHASPLAIDVLLVTVLQEHYTAYLKLLDQHSATAEGPSLAHWQDAQRHIAAIWYYVSNLVPFPRGTLTTSLMLHHALWLGLLPEAESETTLLCIPPLRRNVLADFEAMSVARVDEWVSEVYWTLFEGGAAGMLRCFAALAQESCQSEQGV